MFAHKLRVEYEQNGQRLPCPLKWLDSFSMRNFTNASIFDGALPLPVPPLFRATYNPAIHSAQEVLVPSKSLTLATLLLFVLAMPFSAAFSQDQIPGQPQPPLPRQRPAPEDETRARIEKDMAKGANKERWEQLKRDTDSLLKLATELKEYVGKSNENTLSLDVIKKAEQIEKLAHSVKEKMKGE